MKKIFRDVYRFDDIYKITPDFLKSISISAIVSDLDNTLADYDTPEPTEKILKWIEALRAGGIAFSIVSNNNMERVEKFCSGLGISYYWKSGKPRKKTILEAISSMGVEKEHTAMLGDKYTTDVLGARNCGIIMLKVRSIKPRWKRS